ncbi:MAG: deoxyribonuclease V [Dehalococcoidia bacterium]
MIARSLHNWRLTPSQAVAIQNELSGLVIREELPRDVRTIAGVDISISRQNRVARGAVVILGYPELEPLETCVAERTLDFPYVPGLLSFREIPVILDACEKVVNAPDLIIVDGQGVAHPRRFGLASHLGVILDRPTVGCAKSRLCGEHQQAGPERGQWTELLDGDEVIGAVLRTRSNVKPLYISTGHRITLEAAIRWVLNCGRGYRLPEPTRLAHQAAGKKIG